MNLNLIGKSQIFFLKKSLIFLKNQKKNIDIGINPGFYLTAWTDEIGLLTLKSFSNISFLEKTRLILKYFYKHFNYSDLIVQHSLLKKKTFKRLVVSWGSKNDVKNNLFHDKYFSVRCKDNSDTLWIVFISNKDLKKITYKDKNLILVSNKKNYFFNIFKIISSFFNLIFCKNLHNSIKVFELPSFYSKFSKLILNYIKEKKINEILMPYECQPFQHLIVKDVKENFPKISTVGYIHSALTPLPTDFIARSHHPEKIIVHGIGQKRILTKFLKWKEKEIIVRSSARFLERKEKFFANKILLPMSFDNENKILENFEIYLKSESYNLPTLKVQNHPAMSESKKHQKLIFNLNRLLVKYKTNFKKKSPKSISIFIAATASIIEALEEDVEVVHIFSDPIFESHNKILWPDIKIKKFNENILIYSLSKKKKLIKFGRKYRTINKWLKNK